MNMQSGGRSIVKYGGRRSYVGCRLYVGVRWHHYYHIDVLQQLLAFGGICSQKFFGWTYPLIEVPISTSSSPSYHPLPGIAVTTKDILSLEGNTFRVFKHNHFVYKLYDDEDSLNPNQELIKSLNILYGWNQAQ